MYNFYAKTLGSSIGYKETVFKSSMDGDESIKTTLSNMNAFLKGGFLYKVVYSDKVGCLTVMRFSNVSSLDEAMVVIVSGNFDVSYIKTDKTPTQLLKEYPLEFIESLEFVSKSNDFVLNFKNYSIDLSECKGKLRIRLNSNGYQTGVFTVHLNRLDSTLKRVICKQYYRENLSKEVECLFNSLLKRDYQSAFLYSSLDEFISIICSSICWKANVSHGFITFDGYTKQGVLKELNNSTNWKLFLESVC